MRDFDSFSAEKKSQYAAPFAENALWVTHPEPSEHVLQLIRRFSCENPRSARLVICGLGFFNGQINGRPLDHDYFKPLVTDYNTRDCSRNAALQQGNSNSLCFYEYDVTALLRSGENLLEITLGNGYYHNEDRPEEPYVSYGDKKAIFDLEIDGVHIVSDTQVQARYLNVISGLYIGDLVDYSAKEQQLVQAVCAAVPDGLWRKPNMPSDCIQEILLPQKTWEQDGIVYDFGVNHSGGVAFAIQGHPGQVIHLQFAEVLNKDRTLNMKTGRWEEFSSGGRLLHRIDQTGTYILSGGVDRIEPQFSWHCYRYVRVTGAEDAVISNMRSLYIHTDIRQTGVLATSEGIFDEIHEKFCRTVRNNLHAGLLTDCPHREKRCYTGDGQIVAEALLYEMDGICFFEKWLRDLCDAQTAEGFIPYTVPYMSGGGGYAWSSAISVVPQVLYKHTGNLGYVRMAYPAIEKWIGYCSAHAEDHIIASSSQHWMLGDWLAPDITGFNVPMMSTLWYYRSVEIAAWFAELLGKPEDAQRYGVLKTQIADAINEVFFDRERLCYCRGIQGENVLPLAFGIVPEQFVEPMQAALRRHYEALNYHFDTGIIATPIVLEYLTAHGMEDIAYKLMTQSDYPSYKFMLEGETTIPEHWSKMWPDYFVNDTKYIKGGGEVSHCHPMFGSVVAWIYKCVVGIDMSRLYEGTLKFAPKLTAHLQWASGKLQTPWGDASMAWSVDGGFEATLHIPEGLKGVVELPMAVTAQQGTQAVAGRCVTLESGTWSIHSKL